MTKKETKKRFSFIDTLSKDEKENEFFDLFFDFILSIRVNKYKTKKEIIEISEIIVDKYEKMLLNL